MFDQPDYSDVSHPSCEDPAEPETCDTCGKLLANQADPLACQCPSCPICGDDHVEAVCPSLVCARASRAESFREMRGEV